jgi:glycosyltransferase involved in cell wall biosynthesis
VKPKKHILVVSQYFYPETFRINDMCLEWVKRKYKVTVVTGIPNYPMGKTFKGYGITKKRHEVWNGIEIYRIPLIPRGSGSLGMIANYLSFMVSGMLAGKMKNIKADLVFSFEVSPMTQVMTGISFAKKLHVPHYLYVQDLWPENVITVTGIRNPLIIKPIDKMVDYIYKNSDEIFATSPSFVEAICNRKVAVNREKVHYWPQYAEEFYKPIDKSIAKEAAAAYGIPNDDSFKIIFTGNVGTAQGIDILPQTAELLKNENIKFVIIGDGRYLEKLVSDIKSRQLEKMFIFVARQPAEKIPVLLSACDVAFISFADDELWKMTIPAKLQSYMACGMPIIAVADGETKRIIEEAKCGWVCKMGDSRGLKKTIHEVMKIDLQEMMKHSLCYYNNNYKKEKVISKIMDYLD